MNGPNEVLDELEDGPGKGAALLDSDIIIIDDDWRTCLRYHHSPFLLIILLLNKSYTSSI